MATQAEIDTTLALMESRGFSMQSWGGVPMLTSGPLNQRLCVECGRWRKLGQFQAVQSVCESCVKVRGRLRYAAKQIEERRKS